MTNMNDTNYISIDGTDTITITDYTTDSFTLDDTTNYHYRCYSRTQQFLQKKKLTN